MSGEPDDGSADPFVQELIDGLSKDIFIWRMARAMVNSTNPAQRASAITRMRNAEKSITETTHLAIDREYARQTDAAEREWFST